MSSFRRLLAYPTSTPQWHRSLSKEEKRSLSSFALPAAIGYRSFGDGNSISFKSLQNDQANWLPCLRCTDIEMPLGQSRYLDLKVFVHIVVGDWMFHENIIS